MDSQNFYRNSFKFLVNQDNIKFVLKSLYKHLSIFKFNKDSTFDYQTLTSIYFDNNSFDSYNTRLQNEPDAKILRLRYYNGNKDTLFFECKTKKGLCDEVSKKERVNVTVDEVHDMIDREKLYNSDIELKRSIVYFLRTKDFIPKLKIKYKRREFFGTINDINIRLTFDTNLTAYYHQDLFKSNDSRKFLHLKYAVLELKLPMECKDHTVIDFINSLINKGLIYYFPDFSKYILSACYLYNSNIVNEPYWYKDVLVKRNIDKKIKLYPIALNPNLLNSYVRLCYKGMNVAVVLPMSVIKINELTNHSSMIINLYTIKFIIFFALCYNLLEFVFIKHNLMNKHIVQFDNYLPYIITLLVNLSFIL